MATFFFAKWCILLAVILTVFSAFYLLTAENLQDDAWKQYNPKFAFSLGSGENGTLDVQKIHNFVKGRLKPNSLLEDGKPPPIHIFYYPWYGNPEFDDGKYIHWNHKCLPHWDKEIARKYPVCEHHPPSDVGSSFYPQLGPYSSRDPAVIEQHMRWMSSAGIDVVVVSWLPRGKADEQGQPWDDLIPVLLNAAKKHRMKMTFHMEPYEGRDAHSLRRDIEYIINNYGSHPSLFKMPSRNSKDILKKEKPMLYFYDSYLVNSSEWMRLATASGDFSVRGTQYDILFIGLVVTYEDRYFLHRAGFDGMYSYFASDGFTFGSTSSTWPALSTFCRKNGMLFIPSVGPGYDDLRIRPWNKKNQKGREKGEYYAKMFEMAHMAKADIVSITSFNEWHEGTQIEPAIPFTDNSTGFVYETYSKGSEQYLHITLDLIKKYFTPLHHIAPAKIVSIV